MFIRTEQKIFPAYARLRGIKLWHVLAYICCFIRRTVMFPCSLLGKFEIGFDGVPCA